MAASNVTCFYVNRSARTLEKTRIGIAVSIMIYFKSICILTLFVIVITHGIAKLDQL